MSKAKRKVAWSQNAKHRGVSVYRAKRKRGGKQVTIWLAEWREPDAERTTTRNLTALGLTNAEQRETWAIDKSKELEERREKIEAGERDERPTATSLKTAVKDWLKRAGKKKAEGTMVTYRAATARLLAWAAENAVHRTQALTMPRLLELREHLETLPPMVAKPGGHKGEKVEGAGIRSAAAANRDLRSLRVFLNDAFDRDILPASVSPRNIQKATSQIAIPKRLPVILKGRKQIERFLRAAERHDAERFTITREMQKGLTHEPGRRFPPIADFARFLLLTGLRANEAISLTWDEVDLHRKELRIVAEKTDAERTIDLWICPTVVQWLRVRKAQAGEEHRVFHWLSKGKVRAAFERLRTTHGAPKIVSPQVCRRTCSSYLASAPDSLISTYAAASRSGHGFEVMRKFYAQALGGVDLNGGKTLEEIMGGGVEMVREQAGDYDQKAV